MIHWAPVFRLRWAGSVGGISASPQPGGLKMKRDRFRSLSNLVLIIRTWGKPCGAIWLIT